MKLINYQTGEKRKLNNDEAKLLKDSYKKGFLVVTEMVEVDLPWDDIFNTFGDIQIDDEDFNEFVLFLEESKS